MRNHGPSLSRPLTGLVFTLLIALMPAACTKSPGPASPEFEQARQRFTKLYAQKLDAAFLDPAMDGIEAQLQTVPADSIDAQPAKELLQRIREGRERMQTAEQEKEDAVAAAREIPDFPSAPREPGPAPVDEPPAPSVAPDAGTAPGAGPVAGSPASELSYGYQGCFRRAEPVNVDGKGRRDAWEMESRLTCRQAYPSFADQVLLIEDERVLTVLPKSAIRVTYVGPDGGTPAGR